MGLQEPTLGWLVDVYVLGKQEPLGLLAGATRVGGGATHSGEPPPIHGPLSTTDEVRERAWEGQEAGHVRVQMGTNGRCFTLDGGSSLSERAQSACLADGAQWPVVHMGGVSCTHTAALPSHFPRAWAGGNGRAE